MITLKLGELFCGPGGIALGAIKAKIKAENIFYRIEHEWATDYDLDSCNTYIRNICPDNPKSVICRDVHDLDFKSLPSIDIFAYGFPCNDFSIVGEHKGINGKFGPLYSYGVKVIDFFKPKFFFAENVNGISSADNGKSFEKILFDLENAGNGYKLSVNLYKSEEYGVPQTRHRIIIVGVDKTLEKGFQVPKPLTKFNPRTVREALEKPKIPENAYNNEITKQSNTVIKRLQYINPGQNAWTAELPEDLKLNVKSAKLSQIYKRLHPDKPAYTITGSGGGGPHGYHWEEPRALTNRERARLQTFPDYFIFEGSKESVRKQIGMAVPPQLSEIIFKSILKTFAGAKYQNIISTWHNQISFFNNGLREKIINGNQS